MLVVDDNVDAAKVIQMLLLESGHRVTMAHTGPTALAAALDYRPDVMLLDIGLPELDGYEVAKRIRQEPLLQDIVLVALTGYEQEADRQRAQEAGFDHHLVKPADFAKVRQILAAAARRPLDATFEGTMKTQGEIESAICEGMSRFEQDYMGRGPKDIHSYLLGDLVLVRLRGVLTAAEQHLVKGFPPKRAEICSSKSGPT